MEALADFKDPGFRKMFVSTMLAPSFLGDESHAEEVAQVASWLDATTPRVLAGELRAVATSPDLLPRLPSSRLRLLAIAGALDAATPPPCSGEVVGQFAATVSNAGNGGVSWSALENGGGRSPRLASTRRPSRRRRPRRITWWRPASRTRARRRRRW